MPGDNSFSLQLSENQVLSTRSDETCLITLERYQKLDLLIHLIANLRQTLVISGPSGIGKTTLLNELKARKNDLWPVVTIQSSENLSFEGIQGQILQFLEQHYPEYKNQDLSTILTSLDKQNQKIVVVIDDAGSLVPGLISSVIQYAIASECLRFVFSLTLDELHLKNSSDSAIEDCHFIEIPPLTEKQCGVFLQNLSAKPHAAISFNAVNDQMVEQVYRKTHGIPGKIVSELPKLSNYKSATGYAGLFVVFFIVVIVVIGVKLFVIDEPEVKVEREQIKTTLVFKEAGNVDISSPVIHVQEASPAIVEKMSAGLMTGEQALPAVPEIKQSEVNDLKSISGEMIRPEEVEEWSGQAQQELQKPIGTSDAEEVKEMESLTKSKPEAKVLEELSKIETKIHSQAVVIDENKQTINTIKKAIQQEVVSKPVQLASGDGTQWLLAQPKNNYTIQLIVLSTPEAVVEFISKNKNLKQLKFFQVNQSSQKYVIIYGSFTNAVSASNEMKSLPAEFRKSWIRKVRDLQKKIKK